MRRIVRLQDWRANYLSDVRKTLLRRPRSIPTQYLYAEKGSRLFLEVIRNPKYAIYREEAAGLRTLAPLIAGLVGPELNEIVELGGGNPHKIEPLVRALSKESHPKYTCIDLSESMIHASLNRLRRVSARLTQRGIVADFKRGMEALEPEPANSRIVLLLGNTIANFGVTEIRTLSVAIARVLGPSGLLLVGARVGASPQGNIYSQSGQPFKQLIKNAITTLNHVTDAEISPRAFTVKTDYQSDIKAYCSSLISRRRQEFYLPALNENVLLESGESVTVGVSYHRTAAEVTRILSSRFNHVIHPFGNSSSSIFLMRKRRSKVPTCVA